jgi:hypothetical protein
MHYFIIIVIIAVIVIIQAKSFLENKKKQEEFEAIFAIENNAYKLRNEEVSREIERANDNRLEQMLVNANLDSIDRCNPYIGAGKSRWRIIVGCLFDVYHSAAYQLD